MQLIPQFYDSDDDDDDDLSSYSLGEFKLVERKESLPMCDIKEQSQDTNSGGTVSNSNVHVHVLFVIIAIIITSGLVT